MRTYCSVLCFLLVLAVPVFASQVEFIDRLCVEFAHEGKCLPAVETLGLPEDCRISPMFRHPSDPTLEENWYETGMHCWYLVTWESSSISLETLQASLSQHPDIIQALPDILCSITMTPDDYENWPLWALDKLDCENAWEIHHGAEDIVIAILDTGIEPMHEDLSANLWINPGEDLNSDGVWDDSDNNGVDDDNNGFIDDVMCYDFISITEAQLIQNGLTPVADQDYGPRDNTVYPDYVGHGTYVAGIAGAVTDNGLGIASASWGATIMPVRIAFPAGYQGQETGMTTMSDFAAGIQYAVENGADILNMSIGSSSLIPPVQTALNYAFVSGVVPIGGAGNFGDSSPFYPAAYPNVISVAATDQNDMHAVFSNFGPTITLCAPGVGIISTSPDYGLHDSLYSSHNGTSAACPMVSAATALLLAAEPELDPFLVQYRLELACDPIDSLNPGFTDQLGAGRLNLHTLLAHDHVSSNGSYHVLPAEFTLSPVWPNPFNTIAAISFFIPRQSDVTITIHNVLGQVVDQLARGSFQTGRHQISWDGRRAASGVYFVQMTYPGGSLSQKITLLK